MTNWEDMNLVRQLANIGSEVYRASSWMEKGNPEYSHRAFTQALILLDCSIEHLCAGGPEATAQRRGALKELTRLREVLCDFFAGDNEYHSDAESLNRYFYHFAIALKR